MSAICSSGAIEWSKERTLKLVELMQVNSALWNPAVCESRRDKQKRKEELRAIANLLSISVADVTKKIQHLRTQYNREAAREARVKVDDPNDHYVSNWYAFEFLHFLKDATKPFRILTTEVYVGEDGGEVLPGAELPPDGKLPPRSPPRKLQRSDPLSHFLHVKGEPSYPSPPKVMRDEFSVFGEYVANELRSLKGEKNLLVAKKKIQDAIFDVKIGCIHEVPHQSVETHHPTHQHHPPSMHNGKIFSPQNNNAQTDNISHPPPTTNITEIMINPCHYNSFKVDQQSFTDPLLQSEVDKKRYGELKSLEHL